MENIHVKRLCESYNRCYKPAKRAKKSDALEYVTGLRKIWEAAKAYSTEKTHEEIFSRLVRSISKEDIIKIGNGRSFKVNPSATTIIVSAGKTLCKYTINILV